MSDKKQQGGEKPKLMAKRPAPAIRMRVTEIESKKHMDAPIKGVEIRMDFEEVHAVEDHLEMWFNYVAIYQPDVGHIRMSGVLLANVGADFANEQAILWSKTKQIDQRLANKLLSTINYNCGTESIFIGKLLELPSPIVPPPIELGEIDAQTAAAAAQPDISRKPAAAPAPAAEAPQQPAARPQPPVHPNAVAPRPQAKPAAAPAAQPPKPNIPLPGAPPGAPGAGPAAPQGPRRIDYISPFTGKKPN